MINRRLKEFYFFLNKDTQFSVPEGTECQILKCELDNSYESGIKVRVSFPMKETVIETTIDSSLLITNSTDLSSDYNSYVRWII